MEDALRDAYGFSDIEIGERLEGGYANDLFRVTADGRDLVLRIKHPPISEEDTAWEHRLVSRLARALPEVQAPLPTTEGGTWFMLDDRVAWLVPFIGAAPADKTREQHRIAAARAFGRLHHAGADLDLGPRPRLEPLREIDWPPLVVPPELEPWGEVIAQGREWAIAYVARVDADRRPRTGLTHGDFFPGNVLIADDDVLAVIDWEEAQTDWLTWDLASAAGSFCEAGDAPMQRFVSAYRAAGGTAPPADDDLLLPLLRVKRILEVLRAPTDREPRWELQERNLRSLTRLTP